MAIRRSKEENYVINSPVNDAKYNILQALNAGGFTSIKEHEVVNQITAKYRTVTVLGDIKLTLEEHDGKTKVHAVATANADNVYALFSSPTQKIFNKLKENLKE